VRSNT